MAEALSLLGTPPDPGWGCLVAPPPSGLHFSVQWSVVSDLLADEVVFHGEHGGRARGDANLGVDAGRDGLQSLVRSTADGQSLFEARSRHEAEHLYLAVA